jgi:predicted RNA binding protein YcfA (HicA-like mRNA interferase family)
MPPKIRILEMKLTKAGFKFLAGKGSHRKYIHPCGVRVTISGNAGSDALRYQVREVRAA